jgi:hypothetical protein
MLATRFSALLSNCVVSVDLFRKQLFLGQALHQIFKFEIIFFEASLFANFHKAFFSFQSKNIE